MVRVYNRLPSSETKAPPINQLRRLWGPLDHARSPRSALWLMASLIGLDADHAPPNSPKSVSQPLPRTTAPKALTCGRRAPPRSHAAPGSRRPPAGSTTPPQPRPPRRAAAAAAHRPPRCARAAPRRPAAAAASPSPRRRPQARVTPTQPPGRALGFRVYGISFQPARPQAARRRPRADRGRARTKAVRARAAVSSSAPATAHGVRSLYMCAAPSALGRGCLTAPKQGVGATPLRLNQTSCHWSLPMSEGDIPLIRSAIRLISNQPSRTIHTRPRHLDRRPTGGTWPPQAVPA